MKYIDAEKLTKAIEDKGLDCSFVLKMERLDTLTLIDSLQQEQPSLPSNLDEAAEEWCKINNKGIALCADKKSHYLAEGVDAFIAGAEWQYQKDRGEFAKIKAKTWCEGFDAHKEQMLKDAVEGLICATVTGTKAISFLSPLPKELTAGDKVRIVILKAEEE